MCVACFHARVTPDRERGRRFSAETGKKVPPSAGGVQEEMTEDGVGGPALQRKCQVAPRRGPVPGGESPPTRTEVIGGRFTRVPELLDAPREVPVALQGVPLREGPDGGTILVDVIPDDKGVQISVVDSGIGIPEDAQQRIFERFFRGEDPLVMKTAGTGLGLSIVQHLVRMHNGRVWFESEEGEGTTFSVWLPYQITEQKSTAA